MVIHKISDPSSFFFINPCTGAPLKLGTILNAIPHSAKIVVSFFWFTLFHEIAHILNGDTKNVFVDFSTVSSEMETKADKLAGEMLINSAAYKQFVRDTGYTTTKGVDAFAESQKVREYIIQGRLMKEEVIPWKARPRYEWA